MRRAATLLCGLLSLCIPCITAPAAAQVAGGPPVAVRLELHQAPNVTLCPGEERLRQEIMVRTGHDPFSATATRTLSVSIERLGDRLVGKILYLDGTTRLDERTFLVADLPCNCWSLFTYLAVAIAFTLSPLQAAQEVQETPFSPPPCPVCPPGAPCPSPAAASPAPRASRASGDTSAPPPAPGHPGLQLGIGGEFVLGCATALAGTALVQFEPRWRDFSLPLEARLRFPAVGEGDQGTPLDVTIYSAAIAPCLHEGRAFACAVGELGALRLRDLERAQGTSFNPVFFVGARMGLEVPLVDRLILQLRADLMATITPGPLELGDDRWRASPLSAGLGGTFMMRF
ncbi:hypothetical protein [Chondromyces apiculatus]|uniref:Outer membrane protein beta-barrel domain-containing protein n=1 Tax=Chondromyces apiculatus DSM 436 TaxID=1192034 RepID=A0A017T1T4_9BACT|nr:hypothetical protein [Chondromyces apiculatus]EYF02810.1 Hypothetical protein CAP_6545 [Chondromyces apiculatus DSM 436]